jgi:hypothetical protein
MSKRSSFRFGRADETEVVDPSPPEAYLQLDPVLSTGRDYNDAGSS